MIRSAHRSCPRLLFSAVFLHLVFACHATLSAADPMAPLRAQFQTPPKSARPWVYWFWMNGNITRAGITADLKAMHDVGIGGCLIMHIKLGDIGNYKLGQMPPDGPVEFMSTEFRSLFRYAVGEAHRLGMTIDMNNADGFTGSGGPWIPVDKSMKKLVWTETHVRGPKHCTMDLPQGETVLGYYRDVAVVAYPRQPSLAAQMQAAQAKLSAPDGKFNGRLLRDQNPRTRSIVWRRGTSGTPYLLLAFPKPYTADTLVLRNTTIGRGTPVAKLEASNDGVTFRSIGTMSLKWYPAAPSNTVRFDAVKATHFRVSFAANSPVVAIGEIELGRSNLVHYWEPKAGYARYGEWGGGALLYTERKTAPNHQATQQSPQGADEVPAIPRGRVINLTTATSAAGRVSWDVPPGDWTILRIGCTSTGIKNHPASRGGHGLECDKLDPTGVEAAFAGMLAKLIADTGDLAGKSFGLAHIDSWEVGIQNWTESMPAEFKRRNGYDLAPFYPLLVSGHAIESDAVSQRFLWDLRHTILAMIAENYLGRMETLCHANGLEFSSEAGGRQQFLHQPICLLAKSDLPMGEFWPHEKTPRVDGKAAASVAHLYGKPRVGAEAFTGARSFANWQAHPYRLKQIGDDAFCLGINQFVIHYSVHQAYRDFRPGFVMGPWGIHLDRMNTWWQQSKAWLTYLARCQWLLRQGRFVADVLYYPGEDVPHYFGKRASLSVPLPAGFDFDGCDRATLLQRLSVTNGKLTLANGMTYRYLMLPARPVATPQVAARIGQLIAAGATVIGPAPARSPSLRDYPDCDRQVAAALRAGAGRGKRVWGKSFAQIARADGLVPDFDVAPKSPTIDVRYIHRRTANADIYFVANHQPAAADLLACFRTYGKQPQIWDPETGTIRNQMIFDTHNGQTVLPLHLEPLQSVFVVFSHPADRPHIVRVRRDGAALFAPAPHGTTAISDSALALLPRATTPCGADDSPIQVVFHHAGDYSFRFSNGATRSLHIPPLSKAIELSNAWTVSFPAGWGAPDTITLPRLISWTKHPNFGVQHFSGTAIYRSSFSWDPNGRSADTARQTRWLLNLGDVQVIAEVKVNGQDKGVLWKPPFRCDITAALQAGENQLEIRVTNLWPNRLIGDEQFPDDAQWQGIYLKSWPDWFRQHRPRPEPRRKAFTVVKHYRKDSPLLTSGLLGPVTIEQRAVRMLESPRKEAMP